MLGIKQADAQESGLSRPQGLAFHTTLHQGTVDHLVAGSTIPEGPAYGHTTDYKQMG